MSEHIIGPIIAIVVLGVIAQWLGWLLGIPALLLLILFGFLAGPVSGIVQPDQIFGELLFPMVSLSVALILFEGGLRLRIVELKQAGAVIRNLISYGAILTWIGTAVLANLMLGLNWDVAMILGATLLVTGPTVMIPMLRHIRPKGRIGRILRWEGILIDPVGAVLAVLTFEAIRSGPGVGIEQIALGGMLLAAVTGCLLGLLGGLLIVWLFRNYYVPDYLHVALVLSLIVSLYYVSDLIQPESGLLTTTVMGIVLANQRSVSVQHIMEFKEHLQVMLISVIFITLVARIQWEQIEMIGFWDILFLVMLIVVVRPIMAWICTIGQGLSVAERVFIGCIAPRGVVAASVASVFALRLSAAGVEHAERLVPLTFLVISGTVVFYSLFSPFIARRLGLSQASPQGLLLLGASELSRKIAQAIEGRGFNVALIDSNRTNIRAARLEGLRAYYGNALSHSLVDAIDFGGIGKVLAMTPNDEANSLILLHYAEVVGKSECYQLHPYVGAPGRNAADSPMHLRGRYLFGKDIHYGDLQTKWRSGGTIKATDITEEFTYQSFKERYNSRALPLFVISAKKDLLVVTDEDPAAPLAGDTIISLISDQGD